MGYTHYWHVVEHDENIWMEFVNDVKRIYDNLPTHTDTAGGYHIEDDLVICGGLGEGEPTFDETMIDFNGNESDDLDHETFRIKREGELGFDFCKTARKPYDLLACATLLLYKKYFPSAKTSTDGDESDWAPAVELVEKVIGLKLKAPK
jgi:hypothetical protein